MRGIRVTFGTFVANDGVDLTVGAGEIHALLGENGAGKSTLMRVLAGLLVPAAGEMRIDGTIEPLGTAHEAMRLGIGMVHQHFMLVPTLTVAENVCLGLSSTGRFIPDLQDRRRENPRRWPQTYGLDVDPNARIADLSIAGQQRVEILKALYRGARILVLDEPTAVLTPQEAEGLFRILRSLAAEGTAIIFISHKLNEVMALTSKVTVLRPARSSRRPRTAETDARGLARMMVGAEIALPKLEDVVPTVDAPNSAPRGGDWDGARAHPVRRRHLTCRDSRGPARVDGVSLVVRLARSSASRASMAMASRNWPRRSSVCGRSRAARSRSRARMSPAPMSPAASRSGWPISRRTGIARLWRCRRHVGEPIAGDTCVVAAASRSALRISQRIATARRSSSRCRSATMPCWSASATRRSRKRGWIDRPAIAGAGGEHDEGLRRPRQRAGSQSVGTLSGGNQQKIVLGRALSRDPRLLVAVQPARGLDVGATAFVHRQLLARRAAGAGVLLVSTELDEILALSDRIVVMFKGAIVGEMARADVTVERLGLMMAGRAA